MRQGYFSKNDTQYGRALLAKEAEYVFINIYNTYNTYTYMYMYV